LRWTEVCLETDGEAAEAVATLLNRWGQGGAVIEVPVDCLEPDLPEQQPRVVRVKAYLPAGPEGIAVRRKVEEGLWHLSQIYPLGEPIFRELEEADWAEAWKQQFGLLRVSPRLVIVPAWQTYHAQDGEASIRLEPGMAFGTGLHPTTRLCLQAVEHHISPGATVLDVGTGSGILAIGAAKMGATTVLALDVDPVAVQAARDNAAANGVESMVRVRHGSILPDRRLPARLVEAQVGSYAVVEEGLFDLVLANILAPVIIAMAPALADRLARRGTLVVAGLIDTQEAEVQAALRDQGLEPVNRWQEQDWVVLALQRAL
jgi:ribosomal protein L11 methyltransferase